MTSNIGTRQLKEFGRGVGFTSKSMEDSTNDYQKSVITKALNKAFAPEFLNRIDDVVLFNSLSKEDLHKIIDIELKGLILLKKVTTLNLEPVLLKGQYKNTLRIRWLK